MIPASVRVTIAIRFSTLGPRSVSAVAEVCIPSLVCAFRNGLRRSAATHARELGRARTVRRSGLWPLTAP